MTAEKAEDKVTTIINRLTETIAGYISPEKIILFGSRATGDAHRGSDIDLAIEGGKQLSFREERKLKEVLDDIAGIYSVDIIFLERVEADFAKRIKECGKVVYGKAN